MSSQRTPVHFVPTRVQIVVRLFWIADLIKCQVGPVDVCTQFEARNGIVTPLPTRDSPRLHDKGRRNEFNVSSKDLTTEEGEGTPGVPVNLGGRTRHIAERLRVKEALVNLLRGTGKSDDLADSMGHGVCLLERRCTVKRRRLDGRVIAQPGRTHRPWERISS